MLLSSSALGLLLALFMFKPALPSSLPVSVAEGFARVERLGN